MTQASFTTCQLHEHDHTAVQSYLCISWKVQGKVHIGLMNNRRNSVLLTGQQVDFDMQAKATTLSTLALVQQAAWHMVPPATLHPVGCQD